MENATVTLSALPLLAYAAGLYALTGAIKRLARGVFGPGGAARVHRYETVIPVALGMATAPTVLPWALALMGLQTPAWPLSAALMCGATAGALSSKIWDLIHKIGAAWIARVTGRSDGQGAAGGS